MSADAFKGPAPIKDDFFQIIRDFSGYLALQKKSGNSCLCISKESEVIINAWGKTEEPNPLFFFEGSETADFFIIDSGTHFYKGKSGQLLKKILKAMNVTPDDVFICNTGDDRSIHKKIKTVSPKMIIALGTKASQSLLKIRQPLEQLRGKFHEYNGIKVMPTYHPSLLLKHPEYKRQVWEDMKQVMDYTGL